MLNIITFLVRLLDVRFTKFTRLLLYYSRFLSWRFNWELVWWGCSRALSLLRPATVMSAHPLWIWRRKTKIAKMTSRSRRSEMPDVHYNTIAGSSWISSLCSVEGDQVYKTFAETPTLRSIFNLDRRVRGDEVSTLVIDPGAPTNVRQTLRTV